jgi:5'-phosphate synthase pdxT subunit
MNKILGILGFQGAFFEHKNILDKIKINSLIVKTNKDLKNIDALIIPGGESTVMTKFIIQQDLLNPLKKFILKDKKPVMGTCAGAILLSKVILDKNELKQGLIPAINLVTERNSYGSQINSFIKNIKLDKIGNFNCIFIRAPLFKQINDSSCEILGYDNNNPIMIRKDNILLCTFHPELENTKIHEYFISNFPPLKI